MGRRPGETERRIGKGREEEGKDGVESESEMGRAVMAVVVVSGDASATKKKKQMNERKKDRGG